ncbi:hypothetical protein PQQ99_36200 [Paraburkholderia sediminicola]|uniref:hypothetical protein n=1 Tax=Paraburkholderia sediminicola TaxID=458836 RepID=UPI0038B8CFCD
MRTSISNNSSSLPLIQRLFSEGPSMALRYDDLVKDGVVQIDGEPLKMCQQWGASEIYHQMIIDLNRKGPNFAQGVGAWKIYDAVLMKLMQPGVEDIVTESLADTPVRPTGQPSRTVNLVPRENGFLIHTRLRYDHAEDRNGNDVCFDNDQPALDIHLRHVVEFSHADNLVVRAVNWIKSSGIDNRTASCYFLSADAVTPSPELRASMGECSTTIFGRLIDFFSRLFGTASYEIYSPDRQEKTSLLDSMPKPTRSPTEGTQGRVARRLIPHDQHVRISNVQLKAFHNRTIDVTTLAHSLTGSSPVNAFAELNFDVQRQLVIEKQSELHEEGKTLAADTSEYQRFEALIADRLMTRIRRADTGDELHAMIRRILRIRFEFGDLLAFENMNRRKTEPLAPKVWRKWTDDPNTLLSADGQIEVKILADEEADRLAQTQDRITLYLNVSTMHLLEVAQNAAAGIKIIQKVGGPVATYLLIQRLLTAFQKHAPKIGVDEETTALEQFATLTKDLFIKETVSGLFDVLAQIHKQYFDVDNPQFDTLPKLKELEFYTMTKFVAMLYAVHNGQKLEVPGKITLVGDHAPQEVDEEEVAGVAILLGLQP